MGVVGRIRDERGQGFVEFALIVPFIILLIGGMVQAGIVAKNYIELHNAVNAAARKALVCRITSPVPDSGLVAAATTFTSASTGIPGASLTLPAGGCPTTPSGEVTFVASATCTLNFPLIGAVGCPNLTASVTENVE